MQMFLACVCVHGTLFKRHTHISHIRCLKRLLISILASSIKVFYFAKCTNKKMASYQSPRKKHKPTTPKSSIGSKSKPFFETPSAKQDENGNLRIVYKCKICEKEINGTKVANLGSHLQSKHSDIYYSKVKLYEKESLALKRLRILLNATELVTINGRPFSLILDSGYQAGIMNKLEKLKNAGMGINFSNPNLTELKEFLEQIANKVRNQIQNDVKGRMVSVMVDICTKNYRSLFGVSVQFIVEKTLIVRSLGLIELGERHTGKYLSTVLSDLLTKFDIKKRQVISITTDNGKNVVKMVNDFNEINHTSFITLNDSVSRSLLDEFNQEDQNVDEQIQNMLIQSDEEALDIIFHEQQRIENTAQSPNVLTSVASEFIGKDRIWHTTGFNCVAHCVQLSIGDSIKLLDSNDSNIIVLCREVTKFLGKQTTTYEMKQKSFQFSMPRIDCKTRWSSTCIMVSICLLYTLYNNNIDN